MSDLDSSVDITGPGEGQVAVEELKTFWFGKDSRQSFKTAGGFEYAMAWWISLELRILQSAASTAFHLGLMAIAGFCHGSNEAFLQRHR